MDSSCLTVLEWKEMQTASSRIRTRHPEYIAPQLSHNYEHMLN